MPPGTASAIRANPLCMSAGNAVVVATPKNEQRGCVIEQTLALNDQRTMARQVDAIRDGIDGDGIGRRHDRTRASAAATGKPAKYQPAKATVAVGYHHRTHRQRQQRHP